MPQIKFEFNEYESAFKCWKENQSIYGDDIRFIISTHFNTSGYWIESKEYTLCETDLVYVGNEVLELEKRIINEIKLAKTEVRTPKFIK